jgi:hypothetical protein
MNSQIACSKNCFSRPLLGFTRLDILTILLSDKDLEAAKIFFKRVDQQNWEISSEIIGKKPLSAVGNPLPSETVEAPGPTSWQLVQRVL